VTPPHRHLATRADTHKAATFDNGMKPLGDSGLYEVRYRKHV